MSRRYMMAAILVALGAAPRLAVAGPILASSAPAVKPLPAAASTAPREVAASTPVPAAAAAAVAPTKVAPQIDEDEKLTPKERIRRAGEMIRSMKEGHSRAERKVEDARAAKDMVWLNCVSDKAVSIKGLVRISENNFVELQEAVSKQQEGKVRTKYMTVKIAHGKVQLLQTEAEQCIGRMVFDTGNTKLQVEETPGVPSDVATTLPPIPPLPPLRPPPASPTR